MSDRDNSKVWTEVDHAHNTTKITKSESVPTWCCHLRKMCLILLIQLEKVTLLVWERHGRKEGSMLLFLKDNLYEICG